MISAEIDQQSVNRVLANLDKLNNGINKSPVIRRCLKEAVMPLRGWIITNLNKIHRSGSMRNMAGKMIQGLDTWMGKTRRGTYRIHAGITGDEFVYWAKKKTRYKSLSKYGKTKTGETIMRTGRSFIPAAIEYGHLTAKGTKTTPRPFMRPALKQSKLDVIDRFADALEKEIKRIGSQMKDSKPRMAA